MISPIRAVDFKATFARLSGHRFQGPVTLEIEGVKGEEVTWDLVASRVNDSVRYLREEGLVG